ncbi:Protein of unknown function [Pyronema omphalodes CBS 100304]|uniref:Uncharacterized protein n=1 Tax=Pyronema omphalodes (strain CBS 100304) TaxID=1076935 RepID=U4L8D7_PYROM|nr:Protein of unknown function [Pyronema omphalodes CBS 100304]
MCTLPIIPLFRSTSHSARKIKTKFTLRAAIKNVAIFLDDICFVMRLEYNRTVFPTSKSSQDRREVRARDVGVSQAISSEYRALMR